MSYEDLLNYLPVKYDLRDKRRVTLLRYLRKRFSEPKKLEETLNMFPMLRKENFPNLYDLYRTRMSEAYQTHKSHGLPIDAHAITERVMEAIFEGRSARKPSEYPEAYGLMVSMIRRERNRSGNKTSAQQEMFEERLLASEKEYAISNRPLHQQARIFFEEDEPYTGFGRQSQ